VGLVRGDGVEVLGAGGGEERVKAPRVEQRVLPARRAGVQVWDAAHDQAAGDVFGLDS